MYSDLRNLSQLISLDDAKVQWYFPSPHYKTSIDAEKVTGLVLSDFSSMHASLISLLTFFNINGLNKICFLGHCFFVFMSYIFFLRAISFPFSYSLASPY